MTSRPAALAFRRVPEKAVAGGRRYPAAADAALFLTAAFALRAWLFGDPVIHVDEQFYLLVGDRMLHGQLPFVDIWDRKPIGLFLIYGAIRLLGGNGIVQYQVVATLFAAATAFVISCIARRASSRFAATVSGLAYLGYLLIFNGAGGQSPVFYNLPMALAALTIVRGPLAGSPGFRRNGCAAMALVGVALQIKTSAVFEGVFFGLYLLWSGLRQGRCRPALAVDAAAWAAIALAPMIAVLATYAALGHLQEFVQANFLSVFLQHDASPGALKRLWKALLDLLPLLVCVVRAWIIVAPSPFVRFVPGWSAAALFGYLVFGSYHDHYALPLLVPFCVAAAPAFANAGWGLLLAVLLLAFAGGQGVARSLSRVRNLGDARDIARITSEIAPRLKGGCLFVYEGDAILYHLTHACFRTRFPFPYHLSLLKEAKALGVDPDGETRRIMRTEPAVVVIGEQLRPNFTNGSTRAIVLGDLALRYRPIGRIPVGKSMWDLFERNTACGSSPSERDRRAAEEAARRRDIEVAAPGCIER